MTVHEGVRQRLRLLLRRNLLWLAPLGLAAAAGLFIGVGFLVAWLWRVTLADIFGLKPISFWQAWGLLLLSQFLFKSSVQPTMRTGPRRDRGPAIEDSPAIDPHAPLG